jgi:hypothetical protein
MGPRHTRIHLVEGGRAHRGRAVFLDSWASLFVLSRRATRSGRLPKKPGGSGARRDPAAGIKSIPEVRMPLQTHRRPELRAPIMKLLDTLVPAVRDGGAVPLTELVEAVAGDRLKPEVRAQLDARGAATFARQGERVLFHNEGPPVHIPLRRIEISIPARLAGAAHLIEGGAELGFEDPHTLHVGRKVLGVNVSVRLERAQITDRRVLVGMRPSVLDQCVELV